jgi:prepilin-type processing-associated H-X9-DG protein
MNNIRQIGLAMIQYAGDNDDAFPKSLGELLKRGYITSARVFVCPSGPGQIPKDFPQDFKAADLAELNKVEEFGSYVMVKGITHAADATAVILYEKDGAHGGEGRNCMFNDGHVEWMWEPEFQELLREQGLGGKEPVRVE